MLIKPHGVMFHHFHGQQHPISQGSLDSDHFEAKLQFLTQNFNLLSPTEFTEKITNNEIEIRDICLTFDDALKSQFDIAFPILQKLKLKAFFFVYSSVFEGEPDLLEVYRHFRFTKFKNIEEFYQTFDQCFADEFPDLFKIGKLEFERVGYLHAWPFYSPSDRWFRYSRDLILGKEHYQDLMEIMMSTHKFKIEEILDHLWMSKENICDIYSAGHSIGLHSYSHPTTIHMLETSHQETEYRKNYDHLKSLNFDVTSMSHPCGVYSSDTLRILESLNIKIGFRSGHDVEEINTSLEVPRLDHTYLPKC